ncbi:MAG: DUF2274 domain-containing protein [Burkholderiaceae bacterium]
MGPLPKTESVKLTFSCSATLKAELDHAGGCTGRPAGEAVDAATLILHMLEAFMARDRGFRRVCQTQDSIGVGPVVRMLSRQWRTGTSWQLASGGLYV